MLLTEMSSQAREDIQREIVRKRYLYDVLKRDCWDSMKVKGKAIKVRWIRNKCNISYSSQNVLTCTINLFQAFHSNMEVMNYPLKERTKKEKAEIERVQNIRKFEMAVRNFSFTLQLCSAVI